jgi:type I restriction enzyme S subunit
MDGYGYRLDCSPYLGGALETKILLEKLPLRKDTLKEVTTGIYHAGRESRQWVESPEYGVPFISGSDLQKADLSDLPLISKRQVAKTPHFTIRAGYTLITRSGTIGKMAYARRDMDGMACSEHVLRVVPDTEKIPSGYLYAYLSSKFGVPLVVSGTYGSIIQGIEPEHLLRDDVVVPRLGKARNTKFIRSSKRRRTCGRKRANENTKRLPRSLSFAACQR